jgi:drug/metabolite transporter (DMT)-like permease
MTLAMAGFAAEDMLIKSTADAVPTGQVLASIGFAGLLVFAAMTRAAGDRVWDRRYLSRGMIVRSVFEVGGRLFYTLSFVLVPLTVATAILQAAPLVVVGGAALVLGERVEWQRWAAVAAGLAGVLLILRPGAEGFDALALLAVLGMLGFAGRDLATRAAAPGLSHRQMGVAGFAMMTLAGLIIWSVEGRAVWPDARGAGLVAGAVVFAVLAYHALTIAMRTGEVSAVAPWRYTRLVFAGIVGFAVFGERPDALTILGSAIVVASGIVALVAGRRGRG